MTQLASVHTVLFGELVVPSDCEEKVREIAAIQQAGRWTLERMVQRYAAKQLATETAALTLLEERDKGEKE